MEKPINISLLDRVDVAAPCSASWEEMTGDERVRHCADCSMNVYNLSAMTRSAAEELITSTEGRLCIRFYRRADGTIITDDCPVGLRRVRQRKVRRIRNFVAASLTIVAGMIGAERRAISGGPVAGMMAIPPEPPARVDSTKKDTTTIRPDTLRREEMRGEMVIMGDMAPEAPQPKVGRVALRQQPVQPAEAQPAPQPVQPQPLMQPATTPATGHQSDSVSSPTCTPEENVPDALPNRPRIR